MVRARRLAGRLRVAISAAVLLVGSGALGSAQSAAGSIDGIVVDQSGGVLPGVSITLTQSAIAYERRVVTDERGFFHAPLLPVGAYELTAARAGLDTRTLSGITVTVGHAVTVRVLLPVGRLAETVTVSTVIGTSATAAGAVVDETAVQNLPVNGRNFIDFVLLTPGVTRDVRLGDVSAAGQRGTLNSLVVDGADNNNTFAGQTLGRTGSGRAPYQFSLEAVKEFQVSSNAFPAEYGRAGGAVINVITRSGTNDMRGTLFEFYRDKALNAANAINVLNNQPKSPYHYHQFGGTLGGPLRADRDFFFASYDGQRNTHLNTLNPLPTVPGDQAAQAALERLRPLAFDWKGRLDQDVFLLKTDHQRGERRRLSVRYNHQNFTGDGFEKTGRNVAFENTGASLVRTRTVNATLAAMLRSSVFNELRVQYARDAQVGRAASESPEAVVRHDNQPVLTIGRNNFSPRRNTIDRVQLADTLTWSHGAHTLKTGVDLQFDRIDNFFPGFFSGSYLFRSLAQFASGRPASYQQNFPGPGTSGATTRPNVQEYSAFVQDQWTPRSDLTVNAGLRYDLMKTAAPPMRNPHPELAAAGIDTSRLAADTNNWGPRLGLAWSPRGRRYVVRGGSGVFYGRTPALLVTAAHSNNGVNVVALTLQGPDAPTYPQRFSEIPAGLDYKPNITYIDRRFANPRLIHASGAFEWTPFPHTAVTATYLFVQGARLPRAIDRNLGSIDIQSWTVAGSGETLSTPVFGANRPFPSFQRVVAFESSADSRYDGLTVELRRRSGASLQLRAAYTLGKVVDTVPDATAVLPGSPTMRSLRRIRWTSRLTAPSGTTISGIASSRAACTSRTAPRPDSGGARGRWRGAGR